jgi:hypothetical protein
MSSVQTTDSPQVRFIHDFVEGYKKRDMSYIAKHVHKDFRRIAYPKSLGMPEKTGEEWIRGIEENMSLLADDDEASYTNIQSMLLESWLNPSRS